MNELQIIQSKIYELRGQKVILDFDLAAMYGVETAQLKRAVRRNIERFEGDDFMFEITPDEFLRCQFGISNGRGGTRYMPFAFTELGVAMLSSVLRSETAIEINRGIVRAFVAVRQMVAANPVALRLSTLEKNFEELKQDLEEIFTDYNDIMRTHAHSWRLSTRPLPNFRAKQRPLHTAASGSRPIQQNSDIGGGGQGGYVNTQNMRI